MSDFPPDTVKTYHGHYIVYCKPDTTLFISHLSHIIYPSPPYQPSADDRTDTVFYTVTLDAPHQSETKGGSRGGGANIILFSYSPLSFIFCHFSFSIGSISYLITHFVHFLPSFMNYP